MRNALTRVPKSSQQMVATLVRSIFVQPDAQTVEQQCEWVIEQLRTTAFGKATDLLSESKEEILAFAFFPKEFWKQIWSNNPQERLNKKIRWRMDVVDIFPNRAALVRLSAAVLAKQHDAWQVQHVTWVMSCSQRFNR